MALHMGEERYSKFRQTDHKDDPDIWGHLAEGNISVCSKVIKFSSVYWNRMSHKSSKLASVFQWAGVFQQAHGGRPMVKRHQQMDTSKNPSLKSILSSPPINEYEGPLMLKYLTFMCAIAYQRLKRRYCALPPDGYLSAGILSFSAA